MEALYGLGFGGERLLRVGNLLTSVIQATTEPKSGK